MLKQACNMTSAASCSQHPGRICSTASGLYLLTAKKPFSHSSQWVVNKMTTQNRLQNSSINCGLSADRLSRGCTPVALWACGCSTSPPQQHLCGGVAQVHVWVRCALSQASEECVQQRVGCVLIPPLCLEPCFHKGPHGCPDEVTNHLQSKCGGKNTVSDMDQAPASVCLEVEEHGACCITSYHCLRQGVLSAADVPEWCQHSLYTECAELKGLSRCVALH